MKETELAKEVVDWLKKGEWTVYQEVQICSFGRRADIVAVRNSLVWVIETKTSLTFKVYEQAVNWTGYANYVSIGIPGKKQPNDFACKLLKRDGVGVVWLNNNSLEFRKFNDNGDVVYEYLPPRLQRRTTNSLKDALRSEHKDFCEAGSQSGGWTPFLATVTAIKRYLTRKEWVAQGEVIKAIVHHYSTDTRCKQAIAQWIKAGVIKGIDRKKENNRIYLKLKDEK